MVAMHTNGHTLCHNSICSVLTFNFCQMKVKVFLNTMYGKLKKKASSSQRSYFNGWAEKSSKVFCIVTNRTGTSGSPCGSTASFYQRIHPLILNKISELRGVIRHRWNQGSTKSIKSLSNIPLQLSIISHPLQQIEHFIHCQMTKSCGEGKACSQIIQTRSSKNLRLKIERCGKKITRNPPTTSGPINPRYNHSHFHKYPRKHQSTHLVCS